jgi:hypothetical protein
MLRFLQNIAQLARTSLTGDSKDAQSVKSEHFLTKLVFCIKPAGPL